jgi:predicted PurR-regulated permease PerM
VSAPSDSPRALIRYTLVGLALTVGICWALWEVSGALVLVYISALVAIGLSPLVNAIERKRLMRQQVPRWAAILVIYLCIIGAIIGVGILVIPAIVTQARDLATELPRLLHQGQQWLIMQRQVGISPVFVIIALLIGGSLLGVIGAILAVPTAAILQVVFQEIVTDTAAE